MNLPCHQQAANLQLGTTGKSSTKTVLMDTAELLMGERGIDGVSLREISAASGQKNYNSVQYHFGSKKGLVEAILEDRGRKADNIRWNLFRSTTEDACLDNCSERDLLKLLWLPDLAIQSFDGSHPFCRFTLQYLLIPQSFDHPFFDRDPKTGEVFENPDKKDLCLFVISRELRARLKTLKTGVLDRRMEALRYMFFCSVVAHDNRLIPSQDDRRYNLDCILDIALGALLAPA